jgi:hypothetical protein
VASPSSREGGNPYAASILPLLTNVKVVCRSSRPVSGCSFAHQCDFGINAAPLFFSSHLTFGRSVIHALCELDHFTAVTAPKPLFFAFLEVPDINRYALSLSGRLGYEIAEPSRISGGHSRTAKVR